MEARDTRRTSASERPLARFLRTLPSLFRVGFASAVAYRAEFLVWVLATNMPLVMLLLWTAVAKEAPVGRFGEAEFVAYFLATLIVRMLTGSWVVWELNFEIRQGTIGMKLLRPIHPLIVYATDNLAALPMRVLVSLPVAILALVWVGHGQLASDPLLWIVAAISIAGAWAMTFCATSFIGTLGFFWDSSMSLFQLWLGFFFVFSGYIVPLELFPAWLYDVVRWLPFRFLLSFPVEAMLGLVDREAAMVGLAVQWAYVALFLVLALWTWRRGLVRYAAFGG